MAFEPDYRYMQNVMANRKPTRLPIYEHLISTDIMEKVLDIEFQNLLYGDTGDRKEFFDQYCQFYKKMTYDTVSFEVCIVDMLPDHGAIMGGKPGPIQDREDFEKFPWAEIPELYWQKAAPQFEMLSTNMPVGMRAIGGIGNGVFEISEDLVGYEYLACLLFQDPELVSDLYKKIGGIMLKIWSTFLERYKDSFVAARFGDDLGFRSSTLVSPDTIREHILPNYKRIINLVHGAGLPFLWHSCGNIFGVMDDVIDLGINAKHSNEDAIAPFEKWISLYGDRIALLGGIDVDLLCLENPSVIFDQVVERGQKFKSLANGYALGSGNSIPDYVPVDGYCAMVEGAQKIRELAL
jgi:uroporphyrinogen decarboxylase